MSERPNDFLPMSEQMKAFLDTIKAEPGEDVHRLVFADWLEEQGDPRGTLMRLQCELASYPLWDSQRCNLYERERRLAESMQNWIQRTLGIDLRCFAYLGLFTIRISTLDELRECLSEGGHQEWWFWIDSLDLAHQSSNYFWPPSPASAIGLEGVYLLADSPHLLGLARLDLGRNNIGDSGVRALADSPHAASLRGLDLRHNNIGTEGALALAESPHTVNLCSIDLEGNGVAFEAIRALRERFGERAVVGFSLG